MALINIREVAPGVRLGLWQMEESVDQLMEARPMLGGYEQYAKEHFKAEVRQMEFLAVRALLYEMMATAGRAPEKVGQITHTPEGKPLLKGYHISISHTRGYAALIISRRHEVAVDIEYVSGRVKRVAPKFLREDEKASDLTDLLVSWCAKETVYKLFSDSNLQYHQMRIKPFDSMTDWTVEVENLSDRRTVSVDFELTMDFVLTYAYI